MEDEVTTTEQVAEEVIQEEIPAEEVEVVPEETQSEEIEIPKPRKPNYQERINELTRKRHEAERLAEERQREIERLRTETKPQVAGRPQLENFATQEAYEDALYDWRKQSQTDEEQRISQQIEREKSLAKFQEKSKKFKEVYEDFEEVVGTFPSTPTMVDTIAKSDDGALLAYYLGRNHEVADKIANLPPQTQIYELGKLETKLIYAQKTQKPTGAPAPISPVGATGGGKIDESKLSDEDWFKLEQKREYEKIKKKLGG